MPKCTEAALAPESAAACAKADMRRDEPLSSARKYWNFDGAMRSIQGAALFGTSYAQDMIWEHQHPAKSECSKQKFLILRVEHNGLGSQIHVITAWLAIAMNHGRVLLLDSGGNNLYTSDPQYCSDTRSLECFVEPVSSCSLEDAGGWDAATPVKGAFKTPADARSVRAEIESNGAPAQSKSGTKVYKDHGGAKEAARTLPSALMDVLGCSPIRNSSNGAEYRYWWRAQGAAYILRPNGKTIDALARREADRLEGSCCGKGFISMHIRHGDKTKVGSEMSVHGLEFPDFLTRADALSQNLAGAKAIFISTGKALPVPRASPSKPRSQLNLSA